MTATTFDSCLFDEPNRGRARKLLELCGPVASSPFETLIDRLEQAATDAWVRDALSGVRTPEGFDAERVVNEGVGGIGAAEDLKAEAKRRMRNAHNGDDRESAVLIYTLAVGAAAFHHGVSISSRPRDKVIEHLLALAGVLSGPLAEVAEGAAGRL